VNVLKVQELQSHEALEREVMLVRVTAPPGQRREITDTASIFHATAIDVGPNSIAFEVSGTPADLARFLDLMQPYGVIDLVKSGRVALRRDGKARALRATG
jgi:acetolactate synthase-1/3 small subunit